MFKGFLTISLLAMTMSTADSNLNTCAVMVIHDIVGPLRTQKINYVHQLHLARLTSCIVGVLALLLTFHRKDLLDLLKLSMDFFVPITISPLFLAIYGFRRSSRTALIGMATVIISILVWQRYMPDIEGSVPAMLANGIAMLLAHYIFPKKRRWLGKT